MYGKMGDPKIIFGYFFLITFMIAAFHCGVEDTSSEEDNHQHSDEEYQGEDEGEMSVCAWFSFIHVCILECLEMPNTNIDVTRD